MVNSSGGDKVRVLHVNSYFDTNTLHKELVRSLDGAGVDQLIFNPQPLSSSAVPREVVGRQGVVLRPRVFSRFSKYLWPLKIYKIWRSFKLLCLEYKPDLVHAHTVVTNGVVAYCAKRFFGVPYVVTVRNTDTDFFFKRVPFFRLVGKAVLGAAERIVLLSPVYRDVQLPAYFPESVFPEIYGKCVVIPNAVAQSWHMGMSVSDRKVTWRVLFLGKLDKNKNLDLVLDSIRILGLSGRKIKLVVVGDGPRASELRMSASDIDVDFMGFISDPDRLRDVMAEVDMLIVPSFRETFGLVYVEAMTQGLPVIYTAGQGFDGFFPDGYVGFAVSSTDPVALADRVEAVYADYAGLSRRATLESRAFDWRSVSTQLLDLYSQALGRLK